MLKLCVLAVIVACVVAGGRGGNRKNRNGSSSGSSSGSHSGSGSGEMGEYDIADFKSDLTDVKQGVEDAAVVVEELEHQARAAQMAVGDDKDAAWASFEEAFRRESEDIGEQFGQLEEALYGIVMKFWHMPGDFVENDVCAHSAYLVDSLDSIPDLDAAMLGSMWEIAMVEDVACFADALKNLVVDIPLDMMVPGYTEHDAIGVITEGFSRVHKIKHAGQRFYYATMHLDAIYDALDTPSTTEASYFTSPGGMSQGGMSTMKPDKRQITKILDLLKRLNLNKK